MLDEILINELQVGLHKIEKDLCESDNKVKLKIAKRAKEQLNRAKIASLVRGDITFVSLIKDQAGYAWSILFADEDEKRLFYFSKAV